MALVLKDRVKETSSSSGTGSITLGGAFPGYQTFGSAIASGSTVYYTIHNLVPGFDTEWEVGVGTFTSPSTLSRDTILSSSTGAKVNFTSGTEGLEVFVTQPAEEAIYINDATGKVEAFGNGTNTITFTNINTTNLVANTVTLTAGTISTNAANATDITNKTYVDGLFSESISYHEAVLVETPSALTATYNQPGGAGNGVGATLTNSGANVALSIDGVSLSNTARVLVDNQANAVQNGVYTVTNPGAPDSPGPGAKWVLTRSADTNTYGLANPNALGTGDAFFVTSGNSGAGKTFECNTPGAITFGTTNITFALISTAQIYAAGTGLNLSNLTFSIANTAVTAATYGNAGAVPQIAVNAQGQITSASNVSINASSITLGTLDNARTTASASNGANTIVLRDSTGSFTANTITATTSNATTFNGTTGSFTNVSGNGSAISAINASNISSGTIANARTTASDSNSASTIVARDANGSFGANIVTATFSGNGASLSAINASNISSGTIANARTTASSSNGASTIVQRDSGGNFSANTVTAAVIGDLSGGSAINASNISSGTIANARTTASSSNGASTIVLRGASGEFAAGAITGASFTGDGSAISAINASNISSGTIANARTTASSSNGASTIVARDAGGNFSANTITATTFSGAVSGDGSAISNINASNISSGTIANARTTASASNGASTIVARDAGGDFAADIATLNGITVGTTNSSFDTNVLFVDATNNRVGVNTSTPTTALDVSGTATATLFSGNGSSLTAINASNISSGTIANARTTATDANGASTIVSRDANGSFTANVVTATTFSGGGGSISAINASNISSGTIANARTTAATANGASTIVLRGTSGEFSAGAITGASFTGDGSALSSINASNLSAGTVASARISGSYTGITGVGTLTAGTWNATAIGAQYGGTGSANLTANNVILGNGASSVQFVAPGTTGNILTSNGTTWVSQAAGGGFAAGTVMLFAQTSAPTGWTKNVSTGDNSALRVTTGAASTGGSVAFTTAFASQTPAGTIANTTAGGTVAITAITGSAGATTLTTPQIPSHSHSAIIFGNGNGGADAPGSTSGNNPGSVNATGGDQSHTHPFSFSSGTASFTGTAHNHTFTGTAINLAVQYIDVIRATKD